MAKSYTIRIISEETGEHIPGEQKHWILVEDEDLPSGPLRGTTLCFEAKSHADGCVFMFKLADLMTQCLNVLDMEVKMKDECINVYCYDYSSG